MIGMTPAPVAEDVVRRERIARYRKLEMDLLCESKRAGKEHNAGHEELMEDMMDLICCHYLVGKLLRKWEESTH